jgi:hypothetical protein
MEDKTLKKRLTISLDYSLLAKLDNRNRSGDVERILKQHFQREGAEQLYDYIIGRMKKEGLLSHTNSMINGYQVVVQDEELENYRINYKDDRFQFRRYNGQIQVNKPPSREWAGVEVLNY